MMSILGCSADELGHVLKALGFRADRSRLVAAPGRRGRRRPSPSWQYRAPANGVVLRRRRRPRPIAAPASRRSGRRREMRRRRPAVAGAAEAASAPASEAAAAPPDAEPRGGEVGGDLAAPAARDAPSSGRARKQRPHRPRRRATEASEPRHEPPAPRPAARGRATARARVRAGGAIAAARAPGNAARSAPRVPHAGVAAHAEGRGFDPEFAVCGAELAQGGAGKAQPGLTAHR